MATANSTGLSPVIPVSWLDDMVSATNRLEAFQAMLHPWIVEQLGSDIRRQSVARGMFDMLEDVLNVHRDLSQQVEDFLAIYRDPSL